ncbi:MAG: hypothetical protein NXI18_08915 [Alphaproteobacteria bacterium]|nr:hypothetical protein [Alphaproteobacteria bacterium]
MKNFQFLLYFVFIPFILANSNETKAHDVLPYNKEAFYSFSDSQAGVNKCQKDFLNIGAAVGKFVRDIFIQGNAYYDSMNHAARAAEFWYGTLEMNRIELVSIPECQKYLAKKGREGYQALDQIWSLLRRDGMTRRIPQSEYMKFVEKYDWRRYPQKYPK